MTRWFVSFPILFGLTFLLDFGDSVWSHVLHGAAIGGAYCVGLWDADRIVAARRRRG